MWMTRWQPFDDIDLQLSRWGNEFNPITPFWGNFQKDNESGIEMYQTEDTVVLLARLPGIDPNNIHVQVTPTSVTLRGEQQKQEMWGTGRSMSYKQVQRTILLPFPVEDGQMLVDNEQGALKVTLLKARKDFYARGDEHGYTWQNKRPSAYQIRDSISSQFQQQGQNLAKGWIKTKRWLGLQLHKIADTLLD